MIDIVHACAEKEAGNTPAENIPARRDDDDAAAEGKDKDSERRLESRLPLLLVLHLATREGDADACDLEEAAALMEQRIV